VSWQGLVTSAAAEEWSIVVTRVSSLLQVLRDAHAVLTTFKLSWLNSPTSSACRDKVGARLGLLLHGRHETRKRPRLTARFTPLLPGEPAGGASDSDGVGEGSLGCSVIETVNRPFFSLNGIVLMNGQLVDWGHTLHKVYVEAALKNFHHEVCASHWLLRYFHLSCFGSTK
jgi:hypothetical protein